MPWVCQVCETDHGGRQNDDPAPSCYVKEACKKKGRFACKWQAPVAPQWTFESAQLTRPSDQTKAMADLNDLIRRAGNIYSSTIGTVVGGDKVKKGKKIKGLNDPNARIDIQNPVKSGTYNVQYQIGDDSAACVIFTGNDAEADVFANLRLSLTKNQKATSPNV